MNLSWHGITATSSSTIFSALHPMFQYSVPPVPDAIQKLLKAHSRVVVVGMGGSVLPLQALSDAAGLQKKILFVDSLERGRFEEATHIDDALFCFVSKSGETLEVKVILQEFLEKYPSKKVLFVTDPTNGALRKLAAAKGLPTLPIPPELGGRFTHFSVFHRALFERFEVNFDELLKLAQRDVAALKADPSRLGSLYDSIFSEKRSTVILWNYLASFRGLVSWIQQALAESLGKRTSSGSRVGVLPVILEGPRDQHSVLQLLADGPQDKGLWFFTPPVDRQSFGALNLESIQALMAESTFRTFLERTQIKETNQPLVRIESDGSLKDAVSLIVMVQAFVEYAGSRLGINAFDQPGVERGKEIARELSQKT